MQHPSVPLLVFKSFSGREQHFANFFLVYFRWVVGWLEDNDVEEAAVISCGPMDPWFELLARRHRLRILPRPEVEEAMRTGDPSLVVAPPSDEWIPWDRFRSVILECAGVEDVPTGKVLVIDRTFTDPFYESGEAVLRKSGGAALRTVPNMAAIAERLGRRYDVEVVEMAQLDPSEQVGKVAGARAIVAQHGAGIGHLVLLPPGGAVVELCPWSKRERRWFPKVAARIGVPYRRMWTRHDHARISPRRVERATRKLIGP